MASTQPKVTPTKKYGPPTIPHTPSQTINQMLETRCSQPYVNPIKAGIAFYICGVFQAITTLYGKINPEKSRDSHTFWMVACGVVSTVIVLKAFLVYQIIMALSFLIHAALFYGAIAVGLFGIALGVSGMVFFDKDGGANAPGTHGPAPGHDKYY